MFLNAKVGPDLLYQPVDMDVEVDAIVNSNGVPVFQGLKRRRKVGCVGELRIARQQRNDRHVVIESTLDLNAHQIVFIEHAAAAVRFGRAPILTYQHEQNVAARDGDRDLLPEIAAWGHRIDIEINGAPAKPRTQAVREAAREGLTVGAPV